MERDILRRGGARGLDDPPTVHRRRQRANLEALIQACRALLQNAQDTATGTIPHLSDLLAVAGATLPQLVLTRFMVTPHVDLDVGHGRLSPRDWLVRGLDPDPRSGRQESARGRVRLHHNVRLCAAVKGSRKAAGARHLDRKAEVFPLPLRVIVAIP